jgi:predicted ABC-type transport system involved in lysophospholipase L1 biosynthesis ATPase subunit
MSAAVPNQAVLRFQEVTHDAGTAKRAERMLHLKDGHLDRITERPR